MCSTKCPVRRTITHMHAHTPQTHAKTGRIFTNHISAEVLLSEIHKEPSKFKY